MTKLLYDENGEVNGAPVLADLQDSLRNAIHGKQHLGQANQDTIYFQAWKGIAQHISPDISNGYWEEEGRVTDAMLRNVNKDRANLAQRESIAVENALHARLGCWDAMHRRQYRSL